MAKICPSCGAKSGSKPFVGAFCVDHVDDKAIYAAPKELRFGRCTGCARVQAANEMYEESPEFYEGYILEKITSPHRVKKISLEMGRRAATVDAQFFVEGMELHKEITIPLEWKNFRCEECKKLSSGYHEVVIQLRGDEKRIARVSRDLLANIERLGGLVTKSETREHGVDLFIADRHAAIQSVMQVHLPYTSTRKLKGLKRGKHHFITTVCFRL